MAARTLLQACTEGVPPTPLRYLRQGALIHVITGIVKRALLPRGLAGELAGARCTRVTHNDGSCAFGVRGEAIETERRPCVSQDHRTVPLVVRAAEARSINRHHVGELTSREPRTRDTPRRAMGRPISRGARKRQRGVRRGQCSKRDQAALKTYAGR